MPNSNDKAPQRLNFKYTSAAASIIFFILVYIFWAFPFRAALSYREQMQLFLTTPGYLDRFLGWPGGPGAYAGEFLTQFFNNYFIGGAILALLITLIQAATYRLCRRISPQAPQTLPLALSFLPAVALWLCMGNLTVTMAFVVAALAAIAFSLIFTGNNADYPLAIVGLTLLYWLIGPAFVITGILAIVMHLTHSKSKSDKAIFTAVTLITLVANVMVWSRFLTYPFPYQLIGRGYLLMPDTFTESEPLVMAACVAAPMLVAALAKIKSIIPAIAAAAVIAVIAFVTYPLCYDKGTYKIINYDYYVRVNNWQGMLDYAAGNGPNLPFTVSATNLALGMTGQLDSQAFRYFQNGPEGLVPVFTKETLSSFNTGEILFQLGMINDARRFYFEGMEAIPNYNKSSRAVRRLAEAAMITGDTKVAEKYLNLLTHTIFYKKWAERNLQLLRTPGGIDSHPFYGAMRRRMPDQDYLYSEGELDKSVGQLFVKDPSNALAMQYLIVYPLLERNLDKFMQYMQVVSETNPSYVPPLAKQGAAFYFMSKGQTPPAGIVPPAVTQQLQQFGQAWASKDPAALAPFAGTLYYYLMQPSMAAK